LAWETFSSSGTSLPTFEIFSSWMRTRGFSSSQTMASGSVTKWGLRYPRSNCMPSTTSTVVSMPFPSSTVMTPSLPTRSKASAMIFPTAWSLLALMAATLTMSALSAMSTGRDIFFRAWSTLAAAARMPRASAIASAPAVTLRKPSAKSPWASTVAVVVPSPAASEVFEAASLTSLAPMFWNLSARSISSATVTPSLVTVGAPHPLSRTAVRPRGPSVLLTASVTLLTPSSRAARASLSKVSCFTAIVSFSFHCIAGPVWVFAGAPAGGLVGPPLAGVAQSHCTGSRTPISNGCAA